MHLSETLETSFNQLVAALMAELSPDEHLVVQLVGEESQFVRFNRGRVRQTGQVMDGQLELVLMSHQRNVFRECPFTGESKADWQQASAALADLRQDLPQVPEDPYMVLPQGTASSRETHTGQLLSPDAIADAILPEVDGLDFTGLYAGGSLIRAYADSMGQRHWFATESFALDYSLFTDAGQAVKGTFAGNQWRPAAYTQKLSESKHQLERLSHPSRIIPKGQYRTYLAPAAMAELIAMFSWGGISEAAIQRGGSALAMLQRGEKHFSPHFHLQENFRAGLVPRFNNVGEVAPLELPIIQNGILVNTLISSRTAKEYGKAANGAPDGEYLRSPEVLPGSLPSSDILAALETGLYVSNLHYLNWSDRPTGRITGMTRYACFWVESGEIIAPIENLRFDETIYRCFGDNLLALTDAQEVIPEVGTYDYRAIGAMQLPGALIEEFTYTL